VINYTSCVAAGAVALGILLWGATAQTSGAAVPNGETRAVDLRCAYLKNPIGLHDRKPCLGWILESKQRGQMQTAYQILVSTAPDKLGRDEGDLWDTGKVASDENAHVEYAGRALASRQAAYWKVRVWDRDGAASPWSEPAFWTTGLLDAADWHAQWVGAEEAAAAGPVKGPVKILRAVYEATDGAGSRDVTDQLAAAATNGTTSWRVSNEVMGGDPALNHVKQLRVDYENGGRTFHAAAGENETLTLTGTSPALRYLRKTFTVSNPVRSATIYVTALGLYELHLNGQRVGDHVLAPDWTDYRKRLRYQAYDVTALVKNGENALAGLIANGWYSGHIGNGGFQVWGKKPALLAQLEITFADGTVQRIVTDGSWKVRPSPVLSTDFMLGETYDATAEVSGWDNPGLEESGWAPALVRSIVSPELCGQVSEPVRQTAEIKAKTLSEPSPNRWTFDLGQNMVGVVRLKVNAPAGTVITMHHAEMLKPDGTVYLTNLRGASSVDHYTCKGGGAEAWQPTFTFHGFRYVEVTGLPGKPALDAVTGIVLGSDTSRDGEFSCSDPRVNQLQSNIQWGQRGNFLSVPTDCPQRDERMGWTGDAEVFVRTATKNANVAAFFTKWLTDVDDAQTGEGVFTDVVPSPGKQKNGVPAWGDAGVICPWTIYSTYNDKQLLEQHLPQMIKWVEWCRKHSTNLIRDKDRGGDYGDWLSIGADTPKDVIGTAYFANSSHLVAKAAKAVGRDDEAAKYGQLFEDIKAAFNQRYVAADGRIKGNTQCCYAVALKFDLLPEGLRAKAAQYLEDDVKAKGWHLSTGFVGVSYLLPVLTDAGKIDTAYRLLMQDSFPSWLFSVKHGATTIWERWDGWTPEKGFQDPGMNSFNHYSLGSCGEWLFEYVAGIMPDSDHPGYKHTIVRPCPGGGLTAAQATVGSVYGRIASGWKCEGQSLTLHVIVPANTTATVYVPADPGSKVTESGKPAEGVQGIKFVRREDNAAVFEVGSGDYAFVSSVVTPH